MTTPEDPSDTWVMRRVVRLLQAMPVSNDPDDLGVILRRYGVQGDPAATKDRDPWDPRSVVPLPANRPERLLYFRTAWRDLTGQLAARQARRRER